MRKKLAIILATVMTVATIFTGCGEKDISGEYTTTLNVVDLIKPSTIDSLTQMGIDISSLTMDAHLTLDEDHNFTIELDPTNFKSGFSEIVTNNMPTLLDNILVSEGLNRAELTDIRAQFLGYESADALIADLTNQLTESLNSTMDSLDQKFKDETISGGYTVSKDTVDFATDGANVEIDINSATIEEDGSLTVSATTDAGADLDLTFALVSTTDNK